MGIFSNLFGLDQAKELTKLGNAAANVKNMLDGYETDPDIMFLYCSAWISKVGVLDLIAKNNWASNYIVYVQVDGNLTKMSMAEVKAMTIDRLLEKVSNNPRLSIIINDILQGGTYFDKIDAQIPQQLRDAITNLNI